eukprot:gene960-9867_t
MFQKIVIVDGKDHLMGRLASVVAKELLSAQKVVVVRCEKMNVSGSLYRNKLKYHAFLNKRFNTNPKKGQFHERAPAKIFKRCVRGMLPYKTPRGAAALASLECYEGVPEKYATKKKMVSHSALRVLRLKPHRKFCVLGELSTVVGWKYAPVVEKLEETRKADALTWYRQKVKTQKLLKQAQQNASQKKEVQSIDAELKALGY